MNLDIRFDFERRERIGLIEAIWGEDKTVDQLKRITKTLRKQYEIDSDQDGLVVTRIDRNGEAFQKGIREGDLVKRVGTEKVESINEFNRLVEKSKSKGTVLLLVKKPSGGSRYFTLNL